MALNGGASASCFMMCTLWIMVKQMRNWNKCDVLLPLSESFFIRYSWLGLKMLLSSTVSITTFFAHLQINTHRVIAQIYSEATCSALRTIHSCGFSSMKFVLEENLASSLFDGITATCTSLFHDQDISFKQLVGGATPTLLCGPTHSLAPFEDSMFLGM